jgi:hypothetical protein
MSNAASLTNAECDRFCLLWAKVRKSQALTAAEDAEFDQLRIRIKIIPWPPVIPPPGTPPPTIIIPVMRPASEVAVAQGGDAPVA